MKSKRCIVTGTAVLLIGAFAGCNDKEPTETSEVDGYTSDTHLGGTSTPAGGKGNTNEPVPPAGTGAKNPTVNTEQAGHPSSTPQ